MNKWILRLGALGIAVAVALGIVASTSAQGPGGQDGPWRDRGDRLAQRLIEVTAEATGLPAEEILTQLREGESLLDIAEANGVEPEVMLDLVKAEVGAEIEAALEDGALDELWANRVSARVDAALKRAMGASLPAFVNESLATWTPGTGHFDVTLAGTIADLAGVEVGDMLDENFTLPSLEDVATRYGLDPDAVLAESEARLTDAINDAVAEGSITQAQADALLEGLGDRLEQRFELSFGSLYRGLDAHWDGQWGHYWREHGRMWR